MKARVSPIRAVPVQCPSQDTVGVTPRGSAACRVSSAPCWPLRALPSAQSPQPFPRPTMLPPHPPHPRPHTLTHYSKLEGQPQWPGLLVLVSPHSTGRGPVGVRGKVASFLEGQHMNDRDPSLP